MSVQLPLVTAEKTKKEKFSDKDSRKILPSIILIILMITFFIVIHFKLADPSTLPIRHVTVSGDFINLSQENLQQSVSGVTKGGFFNVNVEMIQNIIMQEPWVKEVSVKRVWPDSITVNIREQSVIAKWGRRALLNPDAHVFFPQLSTFPKNLPLVFGPKDSASLVMNNMLHIKKHLPQDLLIEELILSERRSWRLRLNNNLIMHLGKENIIRKIENFFRYYSVSAISELERIQYIDMRYPNGFAIRWHSKSKPEFNNRQDNHGQKIL